MKLNEINDSYVKEVQAEVERAFNSLEKWEQKEMLKRLGIRHIVDTNALGKRDLEKVLKKIEKWENETA